jgi:sensor c-di-GMP phosphodiesterase-like protein
MLGTLLAVLLLQLDLRWRSLERQLRIAIRKGKLSLVYQPIVDLETGIVASAETLVRWTKDNGESVSPIEFITLAEDRGFVGEITSLVLKRMVEELGDILREGKLRITINTTAQDFINGAMLAEITERFAYAGIPPSVLGLELTERSTVSSAVASQSLPKFNEAGCKLYIDDFGTGYSSLGYLHTLTIDAIKIDRIFTQTIGTEAVTASVVPQILDMARHLNLQVVVEGIETWEQAEYFRNTLPGIQGQGWLFSRPLPAAEFRQFLARGQSLDAAAPAG